MAGTGRSTSRQIYIRKGIIPGHGLPEDVFIAYRLLIRDHQNRPVIDIQSVGPQYTHIAHRGVRAV